MTIGLVLIFVTCMIAHGWAMLMALRSAFKYAADDISFGYIFGGAFFQADYNRKYLRISLVSVGIAIVCVAVWNILFPKGIVSQRIW